MLNADTTTSASKPAYNWRGLIMRADLAPLTKLVLHTLAGHANEAGEECCPTIILLARETGLSRVSVINHLKKAETSGWIERGKRGLAGQAWARNEYRLVKPDGAPNCMPSSASEDASAPNEVEVFRSELDAARERLMGLETRFRMLEHAGQ